jgi:hypothetical protein
VREIIFRALLFFTFTGAASAAFAGVLEPTKPSDVLMLRSSSTCPTAAAGSLAMNNAVSSAGAGLGLFAVPVKQVFVLRRLSWTTITATANAMVRVAIQNADGAGANTNLVFTSAAQANAAGGAFATETFDPPLVFAAGRLPCILPIAGTTAISSFDGQGYLAKDR